MSATTSAAVTATATVPSLSSQCNLAILTIDQAGAACSQAPNNFYYGCVCTTLPPLANSLKDVCAKDDPSLWLSSYQSYEASIQKACALFSSPTATGAVGTTAAVATTTSATDAAATTSAVAAPTVYGQTTIATAVIPTTTGTVGPNTIYNSSAVSIVKTVSALLAAFFLF